MLSRSVLWSVVASFALLLGPDVARADLVLDINSQALNAIRVSRTPPPMASYHLAMLHAAIYDTANSFTHTHEPYLMKDPAPENASIDAAIISVGYTMLVTSFGKVANTRVFTNDYETALARLPDSPAKLAGIAWGKTVAERLTAARKDSGLTGTATFELGQTSGRWRPTPPLFRTYTLSHWGKVKPFILDTADQFRPPPPPEVTSAAYAVDLMTVKLLGGRDSTTRTEDQTNIAAFWSDDLGTATPPGHWNIIASTVARERKLTLPENARLFALLNLGMADSAIGCWDTKFCYGFWRPETAIREAANDNNPATEVDPEWIPLMPSPTFPDYVSGHSTFSRCAATILSTFFGTDAVPFSTPGEGMTDAVRTFSGFSAAADEVGMSRVFGGIHFPAANYWGQAQGRAIATHALTHFLRPVQKL